MEGLRCVYIHIGLRILYLLAGPVFLLDGPDGVFQSASAFSWFHRKWKNLTYAG